MLIIRQSSAGDQMLVQSKKHTWNTENDLFKYCIYVYMHLRMKTHITYVYTDTCMSTSINTGLLNAGTTGCRDSRIDGGLHHQFEVAQRSCIYICHYMSTLALSQMPEASHLLCRKPNAGIQAQGLCSLRALHIFSIFMYSCICQRII